MFFASGIEKIFKFEKTVEGFLKKVPISTKLVARIAILGAIAVEIVAPLATNYGHFYNKNVAVVSLLALIVFTILATVIYHFPPFGGQYYPFMSNVTTVGGLALAVSVYL